MMFNDVTMMSLMFIDVVIVALMIAIACNHSVMMFVPIPIHCR